MDREEEIEYCDCGNELKSEEEKRYKVCEGCS